MTTERIRIATEDDIEAFHTLLYKSFQSILYPSVCIKHVSRNGQFSYFLWLYCLFPFYSPESLWTVSSDV